MSAPVVPPFHYPEQDGLPLSENTLQFHWIMMLQGGLDAQFRDDPSVFVAGDLLWYPLERQSKVCQAPDVMVVLGRPKGHRSSYVQCEEAGVAPQVVFEVLSPSNRDGAMLLKHAFYDAHGVEEYYVYDPEYLELEGWQRVEGSLREIESMNGWTSPLLGIRFEQDAAGELAVHHPDGRRFLTYVEVEEEREKEAEGRQREAKARQREAKARKLAEDAADKLRQQLKALGVDPQA